MGSSLQILKTAATSTATCDRTRVVRSHKGSGHGGPTHATGARAGSNQPHMLLDTQVWASDADLSARVGRKGVGVRKRLDIGGCGGQRQQSQAATTAGASQRRASSGVLTLSACGGVLDVAAVCSRRREENII